MNRKRIVLIALAAVLIAGVIICIAAFKRIEANLSKLSGLPVVKIDLSTLSDGTYTGSYKAFPVEAEVKVTISNHRIVSIKLIKHNNGQGEAAAVIPERVVEAQTLEIDHISGATYSSKVILKAIENALTNSTSK
ncbi:MAG: FMN-binding protein [Bacillota bacterium]